jgi:uncharacterized membrane protein (Fun14 family)
MRIVWLIGIGLAIGWLAGYLLKSNNFAVIMLVGAITVAVIEFAGMLWRRSKDR